MNTKAIQRQFAAMGAEARFAAIPRRPWQAEDVRPRFAVDVRDGVFEIQLNRVAERSVECVVQDIAAADRHLLLNMKSPDDKGLMITSKFLCGHDERFWFAAAVPESAAANTVHAAKEALKPALVRNAQLHRQVRAKDLHKHRNAAFVRQGEWFFVPAPDLVVDDWLILKKEPLRRGRGKPHVAEFLYRRGGTIVHVCRQHPNGLTERAYRDLLLRDPGAKEYRWQTMSRNPQAFVKGRVTHPDHKTIRLSSWHRVVPNTEAESRAGTNLAFLD